MKPNFSLRRLRVVILSAALCLTVSSSDAAAQGAPSLLGIEVPGSASAIVRRSPARLAVGEGVKQYVRDGSVDGGRLAFAVGGAYVAAWILAPEVAALGLVIEAGGAMLGEWMYEAIPSIPSKMLNYSLRLSGRR
jgi:hypothetical protein